MMNNEIQHGYLVVADLSGYTSYLAGTELTHARDILTELLELIVQRFKPLLNIVQLEGDAVFAHVPKSKLQRDETLLEMMESSYLAFRDRVEGIRRRTTCQCNACKAIPTLDLKFIVHFGEYVLQNVSGIMELVGSDVNLVHRLLKNHVAEATGWKAYSLFTEAGLTQLNVKLENLHEQVESYEHLGAVKTYSLNLRARYQELIEARRVCISPEEADYVLTQTVRASPVTVWDWMNDIQKRLQWDLHEIRPLIRPGGRTGPGAQNHCAHGKNVTVETVLDWHPFESYTISTSMMVSSYRLEEGVDETRIHMYFKLKMLPRWLARPLMRLASKLSKLEERYDTLARLIAKDANKS
jgi:hypothetical protein